MPTDIPCSGPAFEKMMREIDTQLSSARTPIAQRPMHAQRAVAMKFKIPVPISKLPANAPVELRQFEPLSHAISAWYDDNYADRLKQEMAVGKVVVLMDNDLWAIRIPTIMGTVNFDITRKLRGGENRTARSNLQCNVLDLVENLTAAKAENLSNHDLESVKIGFHYGLQAHYILFHNEHYDLIKFARGDVKTAVACLMDHDRYGESKWASLQAAEKSIKAAISLKIGNYPQGHYLYKLCEKLEEVGINFDWKPLADNLQCTGGIRYGEERCSREDALLAHLSSLQIIVALAENGANFARGLA